MDLYGKAPTAEVGAYFRNTVWWWHPLWTYLEEIAPELTAGINGHYNDGDGLSTDAATQLLSILNNEITSGRTAEYAEARAQYLASLPDEPCDLSFHRHPSRWAGDWAYV
jgi:hypothetical protein